MAFACVKGWSLIRRRGDGETTNGKKVSTAVGLRSKGKCRKECVTILVAFDMMETDVGVEMGHERFNLNEDVPFW